MARITDIKKTTRKIRVESRTTLEIASDGRYFSMWLHVAGQEGGEGVQPASIQLDKEMARRLSEQLEGFLREEESCVKQ